MKVRLSTAALRDRRDAEHHYEGSSVLARFRDELRAAIRYVGSYPEGAPRVRGELRMKTLRGLPYSLLYRISGDTVRILAIVHQSQETETFFQRD